jgi:amino acid transporter
MVRKAKKQIKSLFGITALGAGAAIGLGAVGGTAAASGAAGIANATSFAPAIGTTIGAGALIRTTESAFNKKKKRR